MPSPAEVKFGAFLSLHPPEQQFALARRCEELGLDSLWTGDHVSFHGPIYESLTLLASDRSAKTTGCTITVDGGVKDAFPR